MQNANHVKSFNYILEEIKSVVFWADCHTILSKIEKIRVHHTFQTTNVYFIWHSKEKISMAFCLMWHWKFWEIKDMLSIPNLYYWKHIPIHICLLRLEEINSKILDLDSAFLIAQLRIFIFWDSLKKQITKIKWKIYQLEKS